MGYNLACILVLPPYQKVGYGRSLIQLAYEWAAHPLEVPPPDPQPLTVLPSSFRMRHSEWVVSCKVLRMAMRFILQDFI